MIWVTTSRWRATSIRLLMEVSVVRAGNLGTSIGLVIAEPWDIIPENRTLMLNRANSILTEGSGCRYYAPGRTLCEKLGLIAFGFLIFNQQDTWFPPGFNPAYPQEWVNMLFVCQFIPQIDMSATELDAALQAAFDMPPHVAEPYIKQRLDDIKEIISGR